MRIGTRTVEGMGLEGAPKVEATEKKSSIVCGFGRDSCARSEKDSSKITLRDSLKRLVEGSKMRYDRECDTYPQKMPKRDRESNLF